MLFSIYLASLIALTSSTEIVPSTWVWPPVGQTRCRLFVYVNAVGKGWIRRTDDNNLTAMGTAGPESQTGVSDATEFEWGVGEINGAYPTLKINENGEDKEIAWDTRTMRSLTLQKRYTPGFTGADWAPPEFSNAVLIRPTELVVQNLQTKVQYCTSHDGKTAILQAAAGDPNYDCAEAVIVPRFIYTTTAYTLPQKVRIGLYRKEDFSLIGWLNVISGDEYIHYGTPGVYSATSVFTLQEDTPGKMKIYWDPEYLRKTIASDPASKVAAAPGDFGFYQDGVSEQFEWANNNPHQLVPSGASTIFHCSNPSNNLPPTFRADPIDPLPQGWTCFKVMWIISTMVDTAAPNARAAQ